MTDAWVTLAVGLATVGAMLIGAVWRISSQFTKAVTTFQVTDVLRADDIKRLSQAIEELKSAVAQFVGDRQQIIDLNRRLTRLEGWYDEIRRGDGMINPRNTGA